MQTWVFDLDGTLVDSFSHYFVLLDEIFRDHGRTFADGDRLPALTEPLPKFFARHLGVAAVTPAMDKLQARSNEDAGRIQVFEGIQELLEDLSTRGRRIAVWTNRDRVSASLILERTGLDRFADAFVSGTCVSRRKPDPEGLLRIIQGFGHDPSEVTVVGDHEHDVSAAKSVGARAVRASWHGYWEIERCAQADAQFFRTSDFADWARRA